MKKDVFEQAVVDVIERERRNLQRASAVLASLSVAVAREDEEVDVGDVVHVARQLIDAVTYALDRVELEKAVSRPTSREPA